MATWDLSLSLFLTTALSVIPELIHVTRAWNTMLERSKGKTLLYNSVSFFFPQILLDGTETFLLLIFKKYLFFRERKRVCVW